MANFRESTEFDLLYAQALELFRAFPDFQFRTVTALLVILGWLLTATSAQQFIQAHASFTLPATAFALGILVVFKFIWIIGHVRRIRAMHDKLAVLAESRELSPDTVAVFNMGPVLPATYLAVNVVLCSALFAVVWLVCS